MSSEEPELEHRVVVVRDVAARAVAARATFEKTTEKTNQSRKKFHSDKSRTSNLATTE